VNSRTPAERAAELSARIHRETNAGLDWRRWATDLDFSDIVSPDEFDSLLAMIDYPLDGDVGVTAFARLGAELRTIALGNRGGTNDKA